MPQGKHAFSFLILEKMGKVVPLGEAGKSDSGRSFRKDLRNPGESGLTKPWKPKSAVSENS